MEIRSFYKICYRIFFTRRVIILAGIQIAGKIPIKANIVYSQKRSYIQKSVRGSGFYS